MIFISHRGNISKRNPDRENFPEYIDEAISMGFEVEVDIRISPGLLPPGDIFLGHDIPQYKISLQWLLDRKDNIWIHAKNLTAFSWFLRSPILWKVFWHQEDDYAMTKNGYIWAYPGKQLGKNTISVMPENTFYTAEDIFSCAGICSDNIQLYRNTFEKRNERKI